jgi:hypothetical protein
MEGIVLYVNDAIGDIVRTRKFGKLCHKIATAESVAIDVKKKFVGKIEFRSVGGRDNAAVIKGEDMNGGAIFGVSVDSYK